LYFSEEEFPTAWTLYGYMREDASHKVWLRNYNASSHTISDDRLMYDFAAEGGSVIELYNDDMLVDSITEIMINDNTYRRKFWLTSTQFAGKEDEYGKETWVEGIGSDRGLYNSATAGLLGNTSMLLCVEKDDELIYGPLHELYDCYFATGISDIDMSETVKVYPNPVTDKIHISNEQKLPVSSIMIYDISGRLIKSCPQCTTEIDMSDVSTGVYIIRISVENKVITHKIIK
jgi:hypothetical protein